MTTTTTRRSTGCRGSPRRPMSSQMGMRCRSGFVSLFFFLASSARADSSAVGLLAHLPPTEAVAGRPDIVGDALATPPTLLPVVVTSVVDRATCFVSNFIFGAGSGRFLPSCSSRSSCHWWYVGESATGSVAPRGRESIFRRHGATFQPRSKNITPLTDLRVYELIILALNGCMIVCVCVYI